MFRAFLLAAAVASCTLLLEAEGHLSVLPGRFRNPHLVNESSPFSGCDLTFTLGGANFNLSALQVDVGGYIADNLAGDGMSYCLNVCKDVTSDRNCVCYPCNGNPYPASQVEKTPKGQVCQAYLGTLDDAVWSLLDSSNPKAGVALTYTHGQGNKSTRIAFVCDPQAPEYPNPAFVGTKGSVYMFSWNSTDACPQ